MMKPIFSITLTALLFAQSSASYGQNSFPVPSGVPQTVGSVTSYKTKPGIYANLPVAWFAPEVYQKTTAGRTEYWVRDTVKAYKDPRPRYFFVDGFGVGSTLDYGPILRGGIYMVRCVRFSGEHFQENNQKESHVMWISIPGPLMEPGEVPVPAKFQPTKNWQEEHMTLLPPYAPVLNKISVSYIRNIGQTDAALFKHGATHTPTSEDLNKKAITTGIDLPPAWRKELPVDVTEGEINLNNVGEAGFRLLTDERLEEVANMQPPGGLWFSDLERAFTPKYYWSANIEDSTLPNYYKLYEKLRAKSKTRLLGDYYRPFFQSKGLHGSDDGLPRPLDRNFVPSIEKPELRMEGCYRNFQHEGKTKSMREVMNIFTADAYPASWMPSRIADQQLTPALYHVYSFLFDLIQSRRVLPPEQKVITFAWTQTDAEGATTRLHFQYPNGRASYMLRTVTPAWWAQTAQMLSMIAGDGVKWWTEGMVNGNNINRLGEGDGDPQWQPSVKDAPSPLVKGTVDLYPRHPFYNYTWAKLGEYQLKHVERSLDRWEFASYKMDGETITAVTKHKDVGANKAETVLNLADQRRPIVILSGAPGAQALFAVHPFGDWRKRYKLSVQLDGKPRDITISGKWPTLVKLSR